MPGEIFPVSARTGAGVPELVEALASLLPEGPLLYPPEDTSDLPERVRLAELVREQVLLRTREELPHAVEVEVEEVSDRGDERPAGGRGAHLGGVGVPEGDPDRRRRADGQGDRHGRAQGDRGGRPAATCTSS